MSITPEDFVALAAPLARGPAQFGYAVRVASDNKRPPGVIALTWITGKDERERIRVHAKHNVQEFLEEPGFIGLRGFTVTAWEDEESVWSITRA